MTAKIILLTIVIFLFAAAPFAQTVPAEGQTKTDMATLARSVTGRQGSPEEKTRRLVNWINTNFGSEHKVMLFEK